MTDEPDRARLAKRRRPLRPVINEPSSGSEQPESSTQETQPAPQPEEPVSASSAVPSDQEQQPAPAMAEEEKAIAEGGSKVTEVQPSTAETTEPAAAQQAGEPEVSNSNAALDFEKFAEETPEVKPEPPTYEEKRQKRSRNPLTRRISRDLEQQLAEAD
ncbi:MAG: hypothetical protein M1341_04060, partial [Candidatus Thermoplasmatota archaeon]|nr:hypothetical protein [Candidatus Thermoplasmatota archaeon]